MKVKLADIKFGKNYSRTFGVGNVDELANSLAEHGQLTPVLVDENNTLIAGFRRVAAAVQNEWTEIEAKVVTENAALANLIENFQRENPSLWEEIQGIKDVLGERPQAEIGRLLSKSRAWVKPRVEVWQLPEEFINKVRCGHSGLKEIRTMLADRRGPSAVSKNMGTPSLPDIKRAVTYLMGAGYKQEAKALSFACGTVTEDGLREIFPTIDDSCSS